MNITKCIITTNKSNIYSEVNDIYYIEDYIGFGNIKKARLLTDEIFLNNKEFIQKYDYDGYKITWAWYDKVYQFSLKCIEIESLIDILKEKDYDTLELIDIGLEYEKVIKKYFYNKEIISSKKKTIITSKIKEFITNSILLIFSMFSIIYFMLKRKNYTAIWTGDFIYKNSTSDFRLNYLYEKLLKNKISYIEFIRTRSLKFFLINTVKRKNFAIYYFSFIYFISYFTKVKPKIPNNFYESILFSYKKDNEVFIKVVKILKYILKLNNVTTLVCFNFSSRKAHLILAAKSLKIKNIGIMHGLSRKEYVVNEFMESYSEDKYIGPDVFGVWSNEYVDYYREHCKIVAKANIYHSGLLRPLVEQRSSIFKYEEKNKIRILIISEPLVDVNEILPYLKTIIKNDKFEIGIKVRPMVKDSFYEKLIAIYPEAKNLKVYDGKILEDGKNFDVFIGSHSTAVIEACLINKLSILIKTRKWDDYFSINSIESDLEMICSIPNQLENYIFKRCENENNLRTIEKIKLKYFGLNKDGSEWIMEQLEN